MGYQDRRLERSARGRGRLKDTRGLLRPCRSRSVWGQREIQFTRTVIDFKVSTLDTDGALSVAEITLCTGRGGAALAPRTGRVVLRSRGEYIIEIGEERYEPGPGDSVLAPRKVAHAWAYVGEGTGRLIAALQPAGEIEAFFDDLAKLSSAPEREELQRAFSSHAMELAGPPLSIE